MRRARTGGLTVLTSIMFFSERQRLAELAAQYRLPAVYPWREPKDLLAKTINQVRDFLRAHQPATAAR